MGGVELAGAIIGLLLGGAAVLGLVYKILEMKLDDRYQPIPKATLDDIQHIRRQVTENHHANAEPTMPDRIDDVRITLDRTRAVLSEDVAEVKQDIKLLVTAYEGRTDLTEQWMGRTDDWMRRTEDRLVGLSAELTKVWAEVDVVKRQVPGGQS